MANLVEQTQVAAVVVVAEVLALVVLAARVLLSFVTRFKEI
jgi:hypothetical protein